RRDLLCGLAIHAGRFRELLDGGLPHRADAAEVLEQARATDRADAGNGVELGAQAELGPAIAVEGVREPMRLGAQPREQVQLGRVRAQRDRVLDVAAVDPIRRTAGLELALLR